VPKEFFDGNRAAAEAVKMARVQVVSAYPITAQTDCVEHLSRFINDGLLKARMIKVESEHSALSSVVGASLVGARTFTASSSQGVQLMSEVLYFASGMRVPVIMAVANRTLSQPVNIWADHQDSLVNRDSGWIQIYCRNAQEVFDNIIQAYKICEDERVLLPAMVCYESFLVSHVAEEVNIPEQSEIDDFLPASNGTNRPLLDPSHPQQFGEVVYPDWYPDFEYKKHLALYNSRRVVEEVAEEFGKQFGRYHPLVEEYACKDAEIILMGMGSMMSTAKWVVRTMREKGERIGLLTLRMFRPFPEREVERICSQAKVLAVLDRDIGYGTSGMLYPDVTRTLYHSPSRPKCLNFIVGLGGKDIIPQTIERSIEISRKAMKEEVVQYVYWPDARIYEGG